jgi:hypothetical protein
MLLRFGEGERLKNWLKRVTERRHLRGQKADQKTLPVDPSPVANGINPADLFDPEEFGIKRQDFQSKP